MLAEHDPALYELVESSDPDEEIAVVIRLLDKKSPPAGVRIVSQFGDIATCRVQSSRAFEALSQESVISMKAPFKLKQEPTFENEIKMDGESVLVPFDRNRKSRQYTGRNVIVACLGWGADPFHEAFQKNDGSTRFLYFWDQSVPMHTDKPNPYGYGIIWSKDEIDKAFKERDPYSALGYHPAKADPQEIGTHDTHTLDIAAGSQRVTTQGEIQGVAPDSDLIFVHLGGPQTIGTPNLGDSVGLLEAVDFVAKSAGDRMWVINMSLGRHGGSHDGHSPLERGIDNLLSSAPGRAVVMSTGNYRKGRTHTHGRIRPGKTRTFGWLIDPKDVTPNELEIWYGERDIFKISISPPESSQTFDSDLGKRISISFKGTEVGKAYHREREPNSGLRQVEIRLYTGAPTGRWKITIHGVDVVDGRYHVWIEKDKGNSVNQSRLDEHDATQGYTINSICNGTRTIAVGGFDSTTSARLLAPFSSCGPTLDGRQKPDVLAPAVRVLAARSTPASSSEPISALTEKSGTSMAAPHVTGCVALIFEAASRKLAISETQQIIIGTAEKVIKNYDNDDNLSSSCFGDGYLNIDAALKAVTELTRREENEIDHNRSSDLRIIPTISQLPKTEYVYQNFPNASADIPKSEDNMFNNDESLIEPILSNLDEDAEILPDVSVGYGNFPENGIPSSFDFNYPVPDEENGQQHSLDSVYGYKIVEIANEYILSNYGIFHRGALLTYVLEKAGALKGRDASLYANLSPRMLYYYFANGNRRYEDFENIFEVIARPGQCVPRELRSGDLLIRVIPGTSSELAAFIVSPELLTYEELSRADLVTEKSDQCGSYVKVIEGGSKLRSLHDPFHRMILDCSGCVPESQLILRIRNKSNLFYGLDKTEVFEDEPNVGGQIAGALVPSLEARQTFDLWEGTIDRFKYIKVKFKVRVAFIGKIKNKKGMVEIKFDEKSEENRQSITYKLQSEISKNIEIEGEYEPGKEAKIGVKTKLFGPIGFELAAKFNWSAVIEGKVEAPFYKDIEIGNLLFQGGGKLMLIFEIGPNWKRIVAEKLLRNLISKGWDYFKTYVVDAIGGWFITEAGVYTTVAVVGIGIGVAAAALVFEFGALAFLGNAAIEGILERIGRDYASAYANALAYFTINRDNKIFTINDKTLPIWPGEKPVAWNYYYQDPKETFDLMWKMNMKTLMKGIKNLQKRAEYHAYYDTSDYTPTWHMARVIGESHAIYTWRIFHAACMSLYGKEETGEIENELRKYNWNGHLKTRDQYKNTLVYKYEKFIYEKFMNRFKGGMDGYPIDLYSIIVSRDGNP